MGLGSEGSLGSESVESRRGRHAVVPRKGRRRQRLLVVTSCSHGMLEVEVLGFCRYLYTDCMLRSLLCALGHVQMEEAQDSGPMDVVFAFGYLGYITVTSEEALGEHMNLF